MVASSEIKKSGVNLLEKENNDESERTWPTAYLLFVCVIASLSMSLNMVHFVALNLPQKEIKAFCNQSIYDHYDHALSEKELHLFWGLIMGSPYMFATLGAILSIPLAEKFGRKLTLLVIQNSLLILSSTLCACSKPAGSVEMFLIGRVLFGISYGIALNVLSIYTSECGPSKFRATAGTFISTVAVWVLLGTIILSLPQVLGNDTRWPYLFVGAAILGFGCMLIGCNLPETPKYSYITGHNRPQAVADLRKLHGRECNIEWQFEEYLTEAQQAKNNQTFPLFYIMKTPHLRKGLCIGVIAALARGFCGTELFLLYGTYWSMQAFKLPSSTAKYVAVGWIATQLTSLLSPFVVDRFKRRKLFLVVLGIMMIDNCIFMVMQTFYAHFYRHAFVYIGLAAMFVNSNIFSFGPSPIGFILASEVSPQNVRSFNSSMAMCAYYVSGALQGFLFPVVESVAGTGSIFILIIFPSLVMYGLLYKYMPETNGIPVSHVIGKWIKEENSDPLKIGRNDQTERDNMI